MDADLYSFEDILRNALFQIPKFQRTYAWGETQWEDFWQTTAERALEIETSSESQVPIFMGALVLQTGNTQRVGSLDFTKKNVIDGQQRIVTISVFYAVVRDFYFRPQTPLYETWTNTFLQTKLNLTGTESLRILSLQKHDDDTYVSLIKPKETIEEWKCVMEGTHPLNQLYKFFWTKLSAKKDLVLEGIAALDDAPPPEDSETQEPSPEQTPAIKPYLAEQSSRNWSDEELFNPETLSVIVFQQMKFAVIKIEPQDEEIAFEVFETLNARGQTLDEVDKFRNGYFILDSDNADSNYENYWEPMERKAGSDLKILSTFFHEETIRRFGWTKKEKTYQRLMTHIKRTSIGTAARNPRDRANIVGREFRDIRSSFDAFLIAHKGTDSLANRRSIEERKYLLHLDYLSKLTTNPKTPLVMDVLKWTERNRTDPEIQSRVNKILHSIATLLTRRLVGGVKAQQLRSLLANMPLRVRKKIYEIDPNFTPTPVNLDSYDCFLNEAFMTLDSTVFPTDQELLSAPLRPIYALTGRKTALFGVLWAVERSMNNERAWDKTPATGSGADRWNIEHVLPQGVTDQTDENPSGMNEVWLEDWHQWGVKNPTEDFHASVHAIGNLTILTGPDNTSVSNKPFAEKKVEYESRTRAWLTDDIKDEVVWTREQIELRSRRLLERVIELWPYPQLNEGRSVPGSGPLG